MLAVHRPVLLDFRRVARHLLQDVDREDDVEGWLKKFGGGS